ncbi:MAG: hypothetical protein JJ992_26295, partial [Planctomycetes bacterium]|nr:hypothetical protein [Planctomycetota bacterium]
IEDGDSFSVDDGTKIITFEFDNDGQQVDRDLDGEIDNPGAVILTFTAFQTNVELAETIATAINLAKLGLNAVPIGDGGVHLGGEPFIHIVNADESQLVLEGEPGVRSAFGLKIPTIAGMPRLEDDGSGSPFITDGDTFTISDGTRQVKFEMDNADDPIGGGLTTAPNIVITYHDDSTVDDIANVIVAAIQNAPLQGLSPLNAGNGVITLGEPLDGTSQHFMDVSQTGLSQLGMAGVPAAIPVYVSPLEKFDGTQVAVAIIQAINSSSLDVTAQPGGGDVVLIENAVLVREINPVFDSNDRHLAVTDLAGNPLKPNLLSGETQMTTILGDVNMDFGDAPQTISGDYPTQVGRNGAIHMITDDGLFLGERIDMDPDGQISAGAMGDDQDSESFVVDTSNAPGMSQSASQTPTVLTLEQPLAVTLSDGVDLEDGAWFRSSNDGVTRTYQFQEVGSTEPQFGDVLIPFNRAETKETLAERTVNAVSDDAILGLTPVDLGEGKIHMGGDSLSKGGSLTVSG